MLQEHFESWMSANAGAVLGALNETSVLALEKLLQLAWEAGYKQCGNDTTLEQHFKDIQLVHIHTTCEGDHSLVSLTYQTVICDGDEFTSHDDIPIVNLDEQMEREVFKMAGLDYDGGWPGWGNIISYLAATMSK